MSTIGVVGPGAMGSPIPGRLLRNVGAAAEAALHTGGNARRLSLILERSPLPMLTVDGERRYVEVNRPARLALRLSLEQIRALAIDDVTPPHLFDAMESAWTRLLDTGYLAGGHRVEGGDGRPLDVVYCALADVLPGLHLIAFAPADWPEDELEPAAHAARNAEWLSPREIEVLQLGAEGRDVSDMARELILSPETVRSHLRNIYTKLGVRTRAGAVGKGMRLGLIA